MLSRIIKKNTAMNTKVKRKVKKKKRKRTKYYKQLERQCKNKKTKDELSCMAYELVKIINHQFPDLLEKFQSVADPRKCHNYRIEEIVFAGIALFLFKCGSRNSMDNFSLSGSFKSNYQKAFGHRLPKMDSVANVFKELPSQELEQLKQNLVKELIERKVLDKYRFDGMITVAIDGTGIVTFEERHCDQCLVKKSKNEKKTYFHNTLEAKIVTENGFSISLCTEWIENPDEEYKKQDCERKAFVRLAEKLKAAYPRLNICLCADGLYPYCTFFDKCREYGWKYIVTFKDGNLKRLWKKIIEAEADWQNDENSFWEGRKYVQQQINWINLIPFNGRNHNWIELIEEKVNDHDEYEMDKFVYLTNIDVTKENVRFICKTGRLRWKIEKQGFDQQKNHGYNICHKYCRKSYTGLKNFYQCCQIAHMMNQLLELTKTFKKNLTSKITTAFIWFCMKAFMVFGLVEDTMVIAIKNHRFQIQYIQ